jgi:hypothetical protein
MTEEERLISAWRENKCGDESCEEHRLDAAIQVLTGGKTHRETADKVIPVSPSEVGSFHK